MPVASQEFRDGAATGAAQMAYRLIRLANWGVRIDSELLYKLAATIRSDWGGNVDEESIKEPEA